MGNCIYMHDIIHLDVCLCLHRCVFRTYCCTDTVSQGKWVEGQGHQ